MCDDRCRLVRLMRLVLQWLELQWLRMFEFEMQGGGPVLQSYGATGSARAVAGP